MHIYDNSSVGGSAQAQMASYLAGGIILATLDFVLIVLLGWECKSCGGACKAEGAAAPASKKQPAPVTAAAV